jgi:hypothetical protein
MARQESGEHRTWLAAEGLLAMTAIGSGSYPRSIAGWGAVPFARQSASSLCETMVSTSPALTQVFSVSNSAA